MEAFGPCLTRGRCRVLVFGCMFGKIWKSSLHWGECVHTTYMLTAPLLHPLLVNTNVTACQVMLMNIYLSVSPRFCFEVMFCDFYSPLYLHCLSTPRLITSLLIPSRADLCIPLTILHLSTGCIWVLFYYYFFINNKPSFHMPSGSGVFTSPVWFPSPGMSGTDSRQCLSRGLRCGKDIGKGSYWAGSNEGSLRRCVSPIFTSPPTGCFLNDFTLRPYFNLELSNILY